MSQGFRFSVASVNLDQFDLKLSLQICHCMQGLAMRFDKCVENTETFWEKVKEQPHSLEKLRVKLNDSLICTSETVAALDAMSMLYASATDIYICSNAKSFCSICRSGINRKMVDI